VGIEKYGIVASRQAAKFVRKGQANGHEAFSVELYARSPAPVYLARHGEAAPFPTIPRYTVFARRTRLAQRKLGDRGTGRKQLRNCRVDSATAGAPMRSPTCS
jgi:hypothetical protein